MGVIKRDLSKCYLWREYILIFVCLGSREYQFNRLLSKLDELVEQGKITDEIFAQIGQSDYLPKKYKYVRYMPVDEFKQNQLKSDLIISHGGTGALIGALKMGKKVISVPRLAKYGEHIDDHQTQVSDILAKEGYLKCVLDMDDLINCINDYKNYQIAKKYEKSSEVLNIIEDYIMNDLNVVNNIH